MGTHYQITLEEPQTISVETLEKNIEERLQTINQLMSTYINDSELSRFNRQQTLDCIPLSKETYFVIEQALAVSKKTHGKFDSTLAPLIELWGFDKKQTNEQVPEKNKIEALLKKIGSNKLVLEDGCVRKKVASLSINLSAIAKGYAVDQIALLIKNVGIKNYLVDIGGEIANSGVNARDTLWSIAIESVDSEKLEGRGIQKVISPMGLGVATSGDYRNYFEKNGKRYSHMIDPTNGYPITHHLASVTVLHKDTLMADALATAMMVMGKEQSLDFANKNNIPVFMLVKQQDRFVEVYNDSFSAYIK
jgi:thiamine biosynthesis lipoprotein